MFDNKKTVSLKLQYYLSLVPFLGVIIVWIIGMWNIYAVKKKRIYCLFYYLLTLVPIILFGVVFIVVFIFFIAPLDEFVLKIVVSYVLVFIICACIALTIVSIQKGMLKRFKKLEEKQIENNLN